MNGILRLLFGSVEPSHFAFPAFKFSARFGNKEIVERQPVCFDPTRPMVSWRRAWRTLCKEGGLSGLRFHDLYHHAITELAEPGVPEQTIMAIAGHVSRRMLERYSHVRLDAKRAALQAMAGHGIASTKVIGYGTNHGTKTLRISARLPS